MKIKLFLSYYKNATKFENYVLTPIHVGASLANSMLDMLKDNTGENISELNEHFNENTLHYWAWKNDSDYDYIGFMHYRRLFNFSSHTYQKDNYSLNQDNLILSSDDSISQFLNKYGLNQECIEKKVNSLNQPDVLLLKPISIWANGKFEGNLKEYWDENGYNSQEYSESLRNIISINYPQYQKAFDETLASKDISFCNMFMMKRSLFIEYSQWLFDILFAFYNDAIEVDNFLNSRICGYVSEILLNVFVRYKEQQDKINKSFLEMVMIENIIEPIKPSYDDSVNIVLACDNHSVQYAMPLIESILHKSSINDNYDIIILGNNLSAENKILLKTFDNKQRHIIIFPIHRYLLSIYDDSDLVTEHFIRKYSRLFIPTICHGFKKVIYLDSDIIVNYDLRELFNMKIENKALGVVQDYVMNGLVKHETSVHMDNKQITAKEYLCNYLELNNISQYFNAGVLVWNLEHIDSSIYLNQLLPAMEKLPNAWRGVQDILNYLFKGDVQYMDITWNYQCDRQYITNYFMYGNNYLEYRRKRTDVKIIHYSGIKKPWQYPEADFAYLWSFYNNKVTIKAN